MAAILDLLRSQSDPLYALVDAARHDDVLTLLYGFSPEMRSLYEGESEARLGKSGPYLVSLSSQDDLLKALLRKGWGQAWGVFVTANTDFGELRHHFRTLMMVKRQGDGSEMYFRFYDPRVLCVFLPTCSPEQLRQMFGPVVSFIVEAEGGNVALRFTGATASERLEAERHELSASGGPA